jgi:hypothetical protein
MVKLTCLALAPHMSRKALATGLLGSLLLLSACGPSPTALSDELPYVQATNSCAPTDAPAVSIIFASTPRPLNQLAPPMLTVSVWTPIRELAGRSYRVSEDGSRDGYASYSAPDSARSGAANGTLHVVAVARDSSVVGGITLRLRDGTRVEREFTAPWRPTRMLCG